MSIQDMIVDGSKNIKSHSPELMTAFGIVGVATTAYLAAKGGVKATKALESQAPDMPKKDKAKIVWKHYIPAGISGAFTIGLIFGSYKSTSKRTVAAVAAYTLTERAFTEYKEKVTETLGEKKEQKIRDEITQERVNKHPGGTSEVIMLGTGQVLCCELFTMRYFKSDMESLRKTEAIINQRMARERYVTLSELYYHLGLRETSISDNIGWDSDRPLDFQFTTVISESGEPAIAFDYSYTKPLN